MYSDSQLNITTQVLEYDRGGGDQAFSVSSNPPTDSRPDDFQEKRFRRGDVNSSDGSVFWAYQSNGAQTWLTPNEYQQKQARKREIDRNYQRGPTYRAKSDKTRAKHKRYRQSAHGSAKIKARQEKRRQDPEYRRKQLEYAKRPEVIERRKQYFCSPERREAKRRREAIFRQDPAWRAKRREQSRKRYERMKALGIKKKSKPYCSEAAKARYLARRETDKQYILSSRIRARVYHAIRSGHGSKQSGTEELLGCSIEFLRQHIERQFKGKMSWDNPGSFHIDHIVPVSSFDLTDIQQQRVAFNWQNMRPLPPKKNMSKGAKLTEPQLPLPLTVHSTTTYTL